MPYQVKYLLYQLAGQQLDSQCPVDFSVKNNEDLRVLKQKITLQYAVYLMGKSIPYIEGFDSV